MRPIRRRIIMVLVLILMQVSGLAVIVGTLWFVKVKEVMRGTVVLSKTGGRAYVDIALPLQDAVKVERGSIIHGNSPVISFEARVLQQHRSLSGIRLSAVVLKQATPPGASLFSSGARTSPVEAEMWTRTRRALMVFLQRQSATQSTTESLTQKPIL